jgi:alkylation response protein AidB-like acyl-CoA dehydrogenase
MREPVANEEEDYAWGGRRGDFPTPESKVWLERMATRGWTVPQWPREYGGGGLSKEEAKVLSEEMRQLGCRAPLMSLGIIMLGPVLLRYGTEAQKREHLPKIASGEIRWCQGYSEPGAGSDLAGLKTRAVRDGDCYVVNGQKIWTSHAHLADWIFCLVRTDPQAPKHEGISFLLFDMETPGVTTRPIKLISGSSPFCETFFDNVRVPARHLVGQENQGWTVAKALLQHERSSISDIGGERIETEGGKLTALARKYLDVPRGALPDPILRERITQAAMDGHCLSLTMRRSGEAMKAGHAPGVETSMFKLYYTELKKRQKELMVAIAGFQGLGWEGDGFADEELLLTREWLRSRGNSIEGGTAEIQLNIIAKRVLGLPD